MERQRAILWCYGFGWEEEGKTWRRDEMMMGGRARHTCDGRQCPNPWR